MGRLLICFPIYDIKYSNTSHQGAIVCSLFYLLFVFCLALKSNEGSFRKISRAGRWCNAGVYVWLIGKFVVCTSSVLFVLTINILLVCLANYPDWCHALSCLCDNTCKGSLAISGKSIALSHGSRLLYFSNQPVCAEHEH